MYKKRQSKYKLKVVPTVVDFTMLLRKWKSEVCKIDGDTLIDSLKPVEDNINIPCLDLLIVSGSNKGEVDHESSPLILIKDVTVVLRKS